MTPIFHVLYIVQLVIALTTAAPQSDCPLEGIVKQCGLNAPIVKTIYETVCNVDCLCNHGSPIGGKCHWDEQYCRCKYPPGTHFLNTTNSACIFGSASEVQLILKDFATQISHYFNPRLLKSEST